MVHRQLRRIGVAVTAAALLVVPAGVAHAANTRVAISNYQWSKPDIHINLGEHVTWYWTGPDTMHSVTGQNALASGLDSDPQTGQPQHDVGDSFKLDFNTPGVYQFQCKLHSTVKGTITVSAAPGDPVSEPDPVPQSNVDLTAPRIRDAHLAKTTFGRRGTNFKFSIGEPGRVSADYYRYDADGRRHYAGYTTWHSTVGYNGVRFATKRKHFTPKPGSYLALVTATDKSANTSESKRVKFTIRKPGGK